MSFDADVAKDGPGRVVRVDLSYDNFSSVDARWGSAAGYLDGSNLYSSRVLSVAPIRRGFGQQRVATAGSTELVLDNADGGLDSFVGRESAANLAKMRLRIYVTLFDPGVEPLVFSSKLLGEFALTEWYTRDNTTIRLQLGDDVMGALSQQAALPSLADWEAVGNSANNPLSQGFGRPDSLDGEGAVPVQLAFGEDWLLALPHLLPLGTVDAAYQNMMVVPVCCTDDTGAGDANDVTNLRISWLDPNAGVAPRLLDVPRTVWDDVNRVDLVVWSVERSPSITKDGRTYRVIYLVVRADLGAISATNNWLTGQAAAAAGGSNFSYDMPQFHLEAAAGYPWTALYQMRGYAGNYPGTPQYANVGAGVLAWFVKGFPLSARTQTTSPQQHPVDVLTDLVTHYSNSDTITVDGTAAARTKAGNPNSACFGVVQPWVERANNPAVFQPPPSLRQALTRLAQSSDIDIFINWNGEFSFSSDVRDFTVATQGSTITALSETQVAPGSMTEQLPSNGERFSIYNRLFFTGAKAYPAEGRDAPYQGPYDFFLGVRGPAIADRIIEASLEQGWRPWRQQAQAPWFWRAINVLPRPRIRFRYNIGALRLELGAYFTLSWTRGPSINGPFASTVFQCEALTYAPGGDSIEVEAIWRDDVVDPGELPYLLDDETLVVRSKGATSGSAVPVGGGDEVNFGGTIDLVAMGVLAGDILVLRDTAEAADLFTLNGAWRINTVDVAAVFVDLNGEGNYPGAGTVPNGEWYIARGFVNYPTEVDDPTNYPSGSLFYGKVTNSAGEFSDSSTGNKLLNG